MNFWKNIQQNVKLAMNQPVTVDRLRSGRTFSKGNDGTYMSGDIEVGKTANGKYVNNAVNSTAIKSVEFDPKTENAKVVYQGGPKKYDFPMTKEEFKNMQNSPSKGRWFYYNARRYNK